MGWPLALHWWVRPEVSQEAVCNTLHIGVAITPPRRWQERFKDGVTYDTSGMRRPDMAGNRRWDRISQQLSVKVKIGKKNETSKCSSLGKNLGQNGREGRTASCPLN